MEIIKLFRILQDIKVLRFEAILHVYDLRLYDLKFYQGLSVSTELR